MEISKKIKLLRALKCLQQPELAENIGEMRSSITAWELGRYKPAAAALDRIASLSGINYAWLAADELPIFTNDLTVFDLPARFERPRRTYSEIENTVKALLPGFLKSAKIDLCRILVPEAQPPAEFDRGQNVYITIDNIKASYFAIFACYSSITQQMAFFRTHDARFFLTLVNIIKQFTGAPLSELLRESEIHEPDIAIPCIVVYSADDVAKKIGLPADKRKRFSVLIKKYAEKEEAGINAEPEGTYTSEEIKLIKLLRTKKINPETLGDFLQKLFNN